MALTAENVRSVLGILKNELKENDSLNKNLRLNKITNAIQFISDKNINDLFDDNVLFSITDNFVETLQPSDKNEAKNIIKTADTLLKIINLHGENLALTSDDLTDLYQALFHYPEPSCKKALIIKLLKSYNKLDKNNLIKFFPLADTNIDSDEFAKRILQLRSFVNLGSETAITVFDGSISDFISSSPEENRAELRYFHGKLKQMVLLMKALEQCSHLTLKNVSNLYRAIRLCGPDSEIANILENHLISLSKEDNGLKEVDFELRLNQLLIFAELLDKNGTLSQAKIKSETKPNIDLLHDYINVKGGLSSVAMMLVKHFIEVRRFDKDSLTFINDLIVSIKDQDDLRKLITKLELYYDSDSILNFIINAKNKGNLEFDKIIKVLDKFSSRGIESRHLMDAVIVLYNSRCLSQENVEKLIDTGKSLSNYIQVIDLLYDKGMLVDCIDKLLEFNSKMPNRFVNLIKECVKDEAIKKEKIGILICLNFAGLPLEENIIKVAFDEEKTKKLSNAITFICQNGRFSQGIYDHLIEKPEYISLIDSLKNNNILNNKNVEALIKYDELRVPISDYLSKYFVDGNILTQEKFDLLIALLDKKIVFFDSPEKLSNISNITSHQNELIRIFLNAEKLDQKSFDSIFDRRERVSECLVNVFKLLPENINFNDFLRRYSPVYLNDFKGQSKEEEFIAIISILSKESWFNDDLIKYIYNNIHYFDAALIAEVSALADYKILSEASFRGLVALAKARDSAEVATTSSKRSNIMECLALLNKVNITSQYPFAFDKLFANFDNIKDILKIMKQLFDSKILNLENFTSLLNNMELQGAEYSPFLEFLKGVEGTLSKPIFDAAVYLSSAKILKENLEELSIWATIITQPQSDTLKYFFNARQLNDQSFYSIKLKQEFITESVAEMFSLLSKNLCFESIFVNFTMLTDDELKENFLSMMKVLAKCKWLDQDFVDFIFVKRKCINASLLKAISILDAAGILNKENLNRLFSQPNASVYLFYAVDNLKRNQIFTSERVSKLFSADDKTFTNVVEAAARLPLGSNKAADNFDRLISYKDCITEKFVNSIAFEAAMIPQNSGPVKAVDQATLDSHFHCVSPKAILLKLEKEILEGEWHTLSFLGHIYGGKERISNDGKQDKKILTHTQNAILEIIAIAKELEKNNTAKDPWFNVLKEVKILVSQAHKNNDSLWSFFKGRSKASKAFYIKADAALPAIEDIEAVCCPGNTRR